MELEFCKYTKSGQVLSEKETMLINEAKKAFAPLASKCKSCKCKLDNRDLKMLERLSVNVLLCSDCYIDTLIRTIARLSQP